MLGTKARVALVNKFFYPNAGAETVYLLERELLIDHGHQVLDFAMKSQRNLPSDQTGYFAPERDYNSGSVAGRARSAAASVYSLQARSAFARLIEDEKPDIVHFHNIYHQLTLSLVDAAAAAGVPTVMTLHDYKIACPAYTLFRDGAPCRLCVGHAPTPAFRHSCVKGSRGASAIGYLEAAVSRRLGLYRKIDRLIAPSAFVAEMAVESGYPAERIDVVPNALGPDEIDNAPEVAEIKPSATFVFAGRLEPVKGIARLAKLFASGQIAGDLRVVGDGPDRAVIEDLARSSDRITYLGRLERAEVMSEYSQARAAVLPAEWEENCPMSLLEARAAGTTIVCSASGGLPGLVTDGVDGRLVAGDDDAWVQALNELAADPQLAATFASAGLTRLRRDHSPDAHYAALRATYEAACR